LRQSNKKLAASTGGRLYRLVNIYSLARKIFEAGQTAQKWLHQPQVTPLDFLRTEACAKEVEDLLGRIEYGVVS